MLKNLITGVANKAWVGALGVGVSWVAARTGLSLEGCQTAVADWGNTMIGTAIAGVIGGTAVYAMPNKKPAR